MSVDVAVNRAQIVPAIESLSGWIAATIKDLPDTSIPVPGAEWTVGEVGAHVSDAQRLFARIAAGEIVRHGDGTPGSLAHANQNLLTINKQRDGRALAAAIVEQTRNFLANAASVPPSRSFDTPMGRMDTETMYAYMLTHLLMHGFQVSEALKKPIPVERSAVQLTLPFLKYSMPLVVDAKKAGKLRAIYQLKLRGGPKIWVKLDRGIATVHDEKPGRVDCYVSADPVSLLKVALKIKSQWPMIAKGKLFAWGPKPWLGFRFAGLFVPP